MYEINCKERVEVSELEPFIIEWNVEFQDPEFEKRINNIINVNRIKFQISLGFIKRFSVDILTVDMEDLAKDLEKGELYNILNGNIRFESKSDSNSFVKQYKKKTKGFLDAEVKEYNKIIDSIK